MLALLFLQEVPLIVETCFDDTSARGSMVTGHCIIGLLSYIFSICLMHGISYLFTYILTCTIFLAQIYPNFSWTLWAHFRRSKIREKLSSLPQFLFYGSYSACDRSNTCMLYPLSIELMYSYLAESSLGEVSKVREVIQIYV